MSIYILSCKSTVQISKLSGRFSPHCVFKCNRDEFKCTSFNQLVISSAISTLPKLCNKQELELMDSLMKEQIGYHPNHSLMKNLLGIYALWEENRGLENCLYSGAHISWHELFLAGNQSNHQNLVLSMLTYKFWFLDQLNKLM